MSLSLALLSAIGLSACGDRFSASLPTAPSVVAPVASVKLTAVTTEAFEQAFEVSGVPLSWQMAEGCVFQKPALSPLIFGKDPVSTRVVPSGELWAQWPDPVNLGSGPTCVSMGSWSELITVEHYVLATFVQQDGEWRYCQWDPLTMVRYELRKVPCP